MDYRRLRDDEAFRALYDPKDGPIGREIAALEAKLLARHSGDEFDKGQRYGMLLVGQRVAELAAQQEKDSRAELTEQVEALPADQSLPTF